MTRTAKEIGHLWFDKVWNERDSTLACELMAEDVVGHLEGGVEIRGHAGFLAFQAGFLEAMPDLHIDVVASLGDEHNACVRWTAQGTHSGPGLGLTASGKKVSFRGVTWFEVADGKIVAGRDFWNQDGLLKILTAV